MKPLLTGMAFVFLATTAVFAQENGGECFCPWCCAWVPQHYGDCGNGVVKCDKNALRQDARVKKQLHLDTPMLRVPTQTKQQQTGR
jgi:hypothetical protein